MQAATTFNIDPGGRLRGTIVVPGDKSMSHRSVIFASIAEGDAEISGFLEGEDTLATVAAFRHMGVHIEGPRHGRLAIRGVGLRGLAAPARDLDLGNSGTAMRLLPGVLAGQNFDVTLRGDASLTRRPMARIITPLTSMGARIEAGEGATPPLAIHGRGAALTAIEYHMPVASAQVKSCLLLAGLYADGVTRIHEPAPSRDHTERMLAAFGHRVHRSADVVAIEGAVALTSTALEIPGDISSAAFFLAGASIAPGSDLTIEGVGMNPTRTGVIDILRAMALMANGPRYLATSMPIACRSASSLGLMVKDSSRVVAKSCATSLDMASTSSMRDRIDSVFSRLSK